MKSHHPAAELQAEPPRILLVDDQPANLLVLRAILDDLSYHFVDANSGREALQRMQEHVFAVVLLDVNMPRLDGFETAKLIRGDETARRTPIIFLTAYDEDQYSTEQAYALGAVDYLVKPIVPSILRAKVISLVELYKQRELVEREASQLRLLIQGTTEYAIFMLDDGGRIITWNAGAERLKGYRADEIIGAHFSRFYPQEAIDRGWPEYELDTARSQGQFEDEGWRLRKDGTQFWASVVITALHDDAGNLRGFSKITRDMTERKRAEETSRRLLQEETARHAAEQHAKSIAEEMERRAAIARENADLNAELQAANAESERQRRLYEAILSGTPDFVYVFSLDHRVLYANDALIAMWGHPLADTIGKTFLEIGYEPWHAEMHCREIDRVRETKQPIRGEVPFHGTNGRRIYDYIFVPVFGADGEVEAVAGTTRDVTERKNMEDELRHLAATLSDADHRKDEFLATLAHELRNPLAPIRNALQILKLTKSDAQDTEQSRAMMERQVDQMVRLVDDLMDVSRISRGKMELRRERVPLVEVLASAIETSRPLIEQMGHELSVIPPNQPIVVDADLTRLAQVFLNLLNNAAKYSHRGGHIWLTTKRQGSDVFVSVKDAGIGIAAEQLPRIFEMFSQVDRSLEKSQGGLGIGLTLVQRLVEMHGGSVEARSEGPGHGSEFVVRLPVVEEAFVAPVVKSDEAPKASLRILIVDDSRDGANSLSIMLKMMGNDTLTAYDGEDAVSAAAMFRPDVILMDIGMPKLNGNEACRRIRELPWVRQPIIIAQTGWGQDGDRRRTQDAGFDHHLVKPVDVAALMDLLAGVKTPNSI